MIFRSETFSILVLAVATKDDRLIYLQSTYLLASEQTIQREYASLKAIHDSYGKLVISLDDLVLPSHQGIRHIQAWNFTKALL